mgnify:CR=1
YIKSQSDYDIVHHNSLHNISLNQTDSQVNNFIIEDYIFSGKWYNSEIQRNYMLQYNPSISELTIIHKQDSYIKHPQNTYPYIS